MGPKELFALFKDTFKKWGEEKAGRIAAALAYYAIFSTAPLLVVIIAVTGFFLGEEAAQGQIVGQIEGTVGSDAAGLIQTMIANAGQQTSGGIISTVIGVGILLFGATNLFAQLQDALNTVWGVKPAQGQGIVGTVRKQAVHRVLSFALVLLIGVLLILAVIASVALSTLATHFADLVPGFTYIWYVVNLVLSFAIVTVLFAAIYKFLPDAVISWSDVWVGAAVTSFLFVVGKELIALYFSLAGVSSVYGAAGALVVFLMWVFFSSQIILFGAVFTEIYSTRYGPHVRSAAAAAEGTPERTEQRTVTVQGEGDVRAEDTVREQPRQRSLLGGLRGSVVGLVVGVVFGWMLGSLQNGQE